MKILEAELYILPVNLRIPLKFGNQTLTSVKCARVKVLSESKDGTVTEGWGETPLSVAWVWPSSLDYEQRESRLIEFSVSIAHSFVESNEEGHPFELGTRYISESLEGLRRVHNATYHDQEELPHLAALVAFSAFDLASYDAYGKQCSRPVFELFGPEFLTKDLSEYLHSESAFKGKYPSDYLVKPVQKIPVWHLVGGLDPIDTDELKGNEPDDGYPVLLRDWVRRDGLKCLKVKLRGTDWDWDFERMKKIGDIASKEGVQWLSADFNCTVNDPEYVNSVLDSIASDCPETFKKILYVEQPFPYELKDNQIDVHSVADRKPLYLDESAHDWTYVKLGMSLGWNGVALKTCKTLTGAILSLCWAKENGMGLMVQDLTNPMLAQIPHVLLAAHAGTIMGVESNGMQFYPDASLPEERVHPGIYRRREGTLDMSTIDGPGFGYRIQEIERELPPPVSLNI
ncbi:mandelate racemase/muconate lactonizing enzyme family protein [Verrucomicrobiales bacterium]|nr:mandelate racemase/muconate lactonizing enzyme family protein [Verrucomicrobiales bacterium]